MSARRRTRLRRTAAGTVAEVRGVTDSLTARVVVEEGEQEGVQGVEQAAEAEPDTCLPSDTRVPRWDSRVVFAAAGRVNKRLYRDNTRIHESMDTTNMIRVSTVFRVSRGCPMGCARNLAFPNSMRWDMRVHTGVART